tara:strand:+ start:2574 stop:2762 length:189 start_codon:yes stop_codon:yes gene_type:complete
MRDAFGETYLGCCQEVRVYNGKMELQYTVSDEDVRWAKANSNVKTGNLFRKAKRKVEYVEKA